MPVVLCFVAGILLDRWLSLPLIAWLSVAAVLAASWLDLWRRGIDRYAAIAVLICVGCLGGARHHAFWSLIRADDLSLFAGAGDPAVVPPDRQAAAGFAIETGADAADRLPGGHRPKGGPPVGRSARPVRLVGILVEQPQIRARDDDPVLTAWPRFDRSQCALDCLALQSHDQPMPISGRTLLSVSGHLLHAEAGDIVDVQGWLQRPAAPRNPGAFDYGNYLRQQGIHSVVTAAHPDAVKRLGRTRDRLPARLLGRVRRMCESLFVRQLSPDVLPVASALLLGDRSQLTREIRDSFAESGAMHLLAISGLHVGVLVLLIWFLCRAAHLSPAATSLVVVAAAVGYALMIETRAPVVRAAVFITIWAAGQPWFRHTSWENTLAVCGLAILSWNPADLFNVGAQLSFLSVVAIMVSAGWLRIGRHNALVSDFPHAGGLWHSLQHVLGRMIGWVLKGIVVTAAIWVFTAPLIAAHFHLVSPVGLLINVVLLPFVMLVLWLGFGLMTIGLLLPAAAPMLAWGFESGLRLLTGLVDVASGWKLAHVYLAGPTTWWLAGYYLLLAIAVCWRSRTRIVRRVAALLLAWTVLGLGVGLLPAGSEGLRCTFLSVGHGCAVLVELPDGKTIAYDAGALHDARSAAAAVQNALWQRRRTGLDAIVVSHADIDHFNAVPELLRTLPVGCLLLAQPFLDFEQPAVARLCETAAGEKVPIRLVTQGDRLLADRSVNVQILHPHSGDRFPGDNANSVVLLIEYANRRILLPGDLDGDGLQQLLAQTPRNVDVLLAPHHGGPQANTAELAAWAQPECVVVSTGRTEAAERLRSVYAPDTTILSTRDRGAVTVQIDRGGRINIDTAVSLSQ